MRAIFRIDKNGSVDNFQLTRCTKLAKVCSCFVNRVFELTSQLTSQLTKKVPKNQYFIYNCQLSTINYIKIVFNKKVCLEIDVYTNITEIRAYARVDNQIER